METRTYTPIVLEMSRLRRRMTDLELRLWELDQRLRNETRPGDGISLRETIRGVIQRELEELRAKYALAFQRLENIEDPQERQRWLAWCQKIDEIKEKIPIDEVVRQYVDLSETGYRLAGRCPFHKDDGLSFTVIPEKGLFRCHGCGKKGDVFTFLMAVEGFTFSQALEALRCYKGL